MTVNCNHPVLVNLRHKGFKLSAHLYLLEKGALINVTAHDPVGRKTVQGRSKRGDFAEAIGKLVAGLKAAGIEGLD